MGRRREAPLDEPLRTALLAWYRSAARDLPWRRTRDPYAVWVSEIMLQQTRVDVATPYFLRWMERFPTVADLAAADEEDVLRLWAGLGYYSRARNLHAAAKAVAAHGRFPQTTAELHHLPGIGPYTAGAIASIAFGERVPAVDGNVVRVLARLNGWPGRASSPALLAKVERAATRLVAACAAPGDWNQALMDLGATVCTPRAPSCGTCPVAALCVAREAGMQQRIPAPKRKPAVAVERRAFAVVRRVGDGRILLVRNPRNGLLAGLWSLPGGPAGRPLADVVLEQAGVAIRLTGKPAPARHQFSHRTWEMRVHRATSSPAVARSGSAARQERRPETAWVDEARLGDHGLPSAMLVALAAVGVGKPKSRKGSGRA